MKNDPTFVALVADPPRLTLIGRPSKVRSVAARVGLSNDEYCAQP